MTSLSESYNECRRITSRSGSNFAAAFCFLPREKRRAMEVLYAFMRLADDLADGDLRTVRDERRKGRVSLSDAERRSLLERWRADLLTHLEISETSAADRTTSAAEPFGADRGGKFPSSARLKSKEDGGAAAAVLPAILDVVRRFSIDRTSLSDVIDGVLSDLTGPVRLETEEEAFRYCDRVAGAVGKGVLAILGTNGPLTDPEIQSEAAACGRAFQWTNFLRDIREDILIRGRVYFPMSDFRDAGLDPTELLPLFKVRTGGRSILGFRLADPHDPLTRFFQRQIDRTETFYADSDPLADRVAADSRKVFRLMRERYRAIFQKIVRRRERIFEGPVRLSLLEKIGLILFT